MGWVAYCVAWLAAALFWTLASASSARVSPLETFPYGLLTMGFGAALGVAVWRLTARVAWDWRAPFFYVVHTLGVAAYSVLYATSWMWLEFARGEFALAITTLRTSPILVWNLLMGSWLYLMIAGISYAVRAHRRIRAQETAASEARLLAQQAQLVALRAQINPHFLFNALHSVGALVTIDPARADRALECLGDLLRYALGTESEVSFAREWKFTEDYLAFEQLRLGERLKVDAQIDPAALPVTVPPLILQPLVENAVRHGIADRPDGGRIVLRASVRDRQLVLRVEDDGGGSANEAGAGFGLKSVRRRVAALYGASGTVDVGAGATGFAVTIALPVTPPGDLDTAA